MKKQLWWVAIGVLTLALVGQYGVYRAQQPSSQGHAVWAFQPQSFADVTNEAQNIVTAQVVSVDKGADIVVAAKGEPSGQDVIPTQRITMNVTDSSKGDATAGERIVVFHTGGESNIPAGPPRPAGKLDESRNNPERAQAPAGDKGDPNAPAPQQPSAPAPAGDTPATATNVRVFVLEDDPDYRVGETYFLALDPGPDNTLRPVSPEGRYRVTGNGTLEPTTDSDVGQSLNGLQLADARSAARGETNIPVRSSGVDAVSRRVTTGGQGALPGMPTTGTPDSMWIVLLVAAVALAGAGLVLRRRRA